MFAEKCLCPIVSSVKNAVKSYNHLVVVCFLKMHIFSKIFQLSIEIRSGWSREKCIVLIRLLQDVQIRLTNIGYRDGNGSLSRTRGLWKKRMGRIIFGSENTRIERITLLLKWHKVCRYQTGLFYVKGLDFNMNCIDGKERGGEPAKNS